ncbi:D-ribose pyranase [Salipaludibacillus aurantiacus]|uniref:D-ribose pyranase n=1 Tax=Salipaludibacillus aurantiacus TaxID=1601833 RepID=A0A1H9U8M8_9BACI|nr:D-ribose pyranase [Salipaludibacillus aurantiacus]SES05682.1 D-ribose pyranase [Salipaludibacillus aurantiacus]
MKKQGVINREIAAVLARLGHTDRIAIADCGLPVPDHVPCIDLSIRIGSPSFDEVVTEILNDMAVEKIILAEEIKSKNEKVYSFLQETGLPADFTSHDLLKKELNKVKAIIRTGEATPYANVILQSNVIF